MDRAGGGLFLPICEDQRLQPAVAYTKQLMEAKLAEICQHASISDRTPRRQLQG